MKKNQIFHLIYILNPNLTSADEMALRKLMRQRPPTKSDPLPNKVGTIRIRFGSQSSFFGSSLVRLVWFLVLLLCN